MLTLITIIHVSVAAFIVLCVLLQSGKAGGGSTFGGGGNSQSIFGASGAGNFLTKTTSFCGFIFMLTSLALYYQSVRKAGSSSLKDLATPISAPSTPGAAGTPGTSGAPGTATPPPATPAPTTPTKPNP